VTNKSIEAYGWRGRDRRFHLALRVELEGDTSPFRRRGVCGGTSACRRRGEGLGTRPFMRRGRGGRTDKSIYT
jgi:hypothetical protein